jgi:hypothetical protein
MANLQQPSRREDFEVALICALPLEYNAVSLLFDAFWDEDGDQYGKATGDPNIYTTGCIGKYNVVLALLPDMGKVNAASAAASVRSSYTGLRLALLVGICGGVPQNSEGEEILLGDVIVSRTIVQYDFGRRYPNTFARKDIFDYLGRQSKDIRSLFSILETELGSERLLRRTAADKLFQSDYPHKHHGSAQNVSARIIPTHQTLFVRRLLVYHAATLIVMKHM